MVRKITEFALGDAQYRDIAAQLTKWKWPSDPETLANPQSAMATTIDDDHYWDFKAATNAAKVLIGSMPAMFQHWDGLQWAPETRDGFEKLAEIRRGLPIADFCNKIDPKQTSPVWLA